MTSTIEKTLSDNSANEQSSDTADAIASTDVLAFLQSNPQFFNEYPDAIRDFQIPHVNGSTISLFDRQIELLRDENRKLKVTLDALVDNARANERLIQQTHELALQLMDSAGPQAIFSTLQTQLSSEFRADRVVGLVFADLNFVETDSPAEFVGPADDRKQIFSDMLAKAYSLLRPAQC